MVTSRDAKGKTIVLKSRASRATASSSASSSSDVPQPQPRVVVPVAQATHLLPPIRTFMGATLTPKNVAVLATQQGDGYELL